MTWLPSFASCVLSCRSAWPVFPLSFPLGFKLKSHLPVFLISQSQIQDWNAQYTVIYSLSISVSVRESSMWGPREPCCPALTSGLVTLTRLTPSFILLAIWGKCGLQHNMFIILHPGHIIITSFVIWHSVL